ncbi:PaaI family thioesterase [Microbacterium sp. ANT_H45B]|uniref:PaaI family thioesterase n=1 Tax=Microbacterium sp. ANT_H45B TaxID=2597346 RepID=UPI0011ED81FC|nr:PaaI family thioesterase [Microbacterium sp. ANT_H45B]KAA0962484.1 PaaI family thioesterase [Microbacterium sp. ANT_H45B]
MAIDPFVQGLLDADQSLGWLGIAVTHAEGGFATAELIVSPNMGNGHRVAHGGVVFALADTAFAMAANSVLHGAPTADASIVYLAPSPIGEKLIASAQVTYSDRRRAVVDVTVTASGTTVAVYRGTARTARQHSSPTGH